MLSREIIIQNFYARLSRNDQTMLDTSCAGSFMMKTIEFGWNLLDRIKRNFEDWGLDEGKESGIKLKYDCVKSFMDTDAFQKFSTKYGLDSQILASFCESFATHVDLPKEKWFKYHPPIKEEIKEPIPVKEETILYNVDPVVLLLILRNHLSLLGLRNMLKFQLWLTKAILEHLNQLNKLR